MKRSKLNKNEIIEQLNQWLEELPYLEKAENTEIAYRKAVENFIGFLQQSNSEVVDKLTLLDYKKSLLEEKKQNQNRRIHKGVGSNNTLNLRLTVINRIFNNLGYPDIKVNLENDTTSNVETNVPTGEEYRLFLDKAKELGKERIGLYVQTLAFTGMRISEIAYLTRGSLDQRYFTVDNKGKTRYVFIPKKLKNKLLAYCRKHKIKKEDLIFHGKDPEQPLDQSYIRKEIRNITQEIDKSLLPRTHPHQWRKFFARLYSSSPGSNPYWLPVILGHSTKGAGNITAYYAKGSEEDFLKSVDAMENFYYEQEKIEKQRQREESKKTTRRRKTRKKTTRRRKKNQ